MNRVDLLDLPNVHSVIKGVRDSDGLGKETVLRCLVDAKIPREFLHECDVIPATVEGLPTDVVEAPRMVAFAFAECYSPTVPGGAQIQPRDANWVGTLGCLCEYKGEPAGLSNWHVLVGGRFRLGDHVCQPDSRNRNSIGRINNWVEIKFDRSRNHVDAAVFDCRVGGRHTLSPNQVDFGELGTVNLDPREGDRVFKFGRTTGNKRGTVTDLEAVSDVQYGRGRIGRFVDQIAVSGGMSAAGDSGSLVMSSGNRPYGLLFAGGGGITLVNRISHVMEELNVGFPNWR